jgi:hypothetical protein
MAQLTFPIVPDGLLVDVFVNLEAPALVPLWAAGRPCAPAPGRGLIDTGSTGSGISVPIIQRLNLVPVLQGTSAGLWSTAGVNLYLVSLHVLDQQDVTLPWFSHASLMVMELPVDFAHDVLIGMDVLQSCKTLIDGPAQRFTLEF